MGRMFGKSFSKRMIKGYCEKRQKVENEDQREAVIDYMYQIFLRKGTTEYALMVNFELGMQAKIPLSNPEKLGRTDFPIPFSFVYGDDDWVPLTDDGASKRLIEAH